MRILVVLSCVALATGCAANPKKTALRLNAEDPAFTSTDCRAARNAALDYNDRVYTRMGVGFATGLLLGPFGIPLAAMADAHQNDERKMLNDEITKRCVAANGGLVEAPRNPLAPSPTAPLPAAPPIPLAAGRNSVMAPPVTCEVYALKVTSDPTKNICAD